MYSTGPPVLIEVNMQVRSMGPISEMDMVSKLQGQYGHVVPMILITYCQSYSMDTYFRQSWVDERLSFSGYEVFSSCVDIADGIHA